MLAACKLPESDPRRVAAIGPENPRRACEQLLENPADWHLPQGIVALADVVSKLQERRRAHSTTSKPPLLVTTNFDPLLELALRRKGVSMSSQSVVNDAVPFHGEESVSIWHVHGTWTDVTMHTPPALQSERGKLRAALIRRFERADVFVIGYGGWSDLVFSTLREVLAEDKFEVPPEILWAFFATDPHTLRKRYAHVFRVFSGALASCQVTFYRGVDAHRDLPALASRVSEWVPSAAIAGGLPEQTVLPAPPHPAQERALFIFRLQVSVLREMTELVYRIRNAARDFNSFVQTDGALSTAAPALEQGKDVLFETAALERELRQALYHHRAILPPTLFSILHEARHIATTIGDCIAVALRMRDGSGAVASTSWPEVQQIMAEEFPQLTAIYEELVQSVQEHIGVTETGT